MKIARQKGIETIINPAPAIPLPDEAFHGLGHLIVNETEAAILSGIENPTNWNEVAAVFVARGVKNVIITLGGEVSKRKAFSNTGLILISLGCLLQDC
jgi:ribokinase